MRGPDSSARVSSICVERQEERKAKESTRKEMRSRISNADANGGEKKTEWSTGIGSKRGNREGEDHGSCLKGDGNCYRLHQRYVSSC